MRDDIGSASENIPSSPAVMSICTSRTVDRAAYSRECGTDRAGFSFLLLRSPSRSETSQKGRMTIAVRPGVSLCRNRSHVTLVPPARVQVRPWRSILDAKADPRYCDFFFL
jgi:hypothetical protein